MTDTDARLGDLLWTRGYTDPGWIRRFTSAGRELSPSRRVWRGPGPARTLPAEPAGLDTLDLGLGGTTATLPDLCATAQTDAFLVLHRGVVVHEAYPHGGAPHVPHFNASAAKSYLGLLAATLAHEGLLDRSARTDAYVPELAGTAFGEARVEDLLHMGTQVSYAGRPYDKAIEAQRYHAVIAPRLRPFGYRGPGTIREHLLTARATGAPGTEFRYENGNVEALAEVLPRVTGLSTSALLGELIWSRIGAATPAASPSTPPPARAAPSASCCPCPTRWTTGPWTRRHERKGRRPGGGVRLTCPRSGGRSRHPRPAAAGPAADADRSSGRRTVAAGGRRRACALRIPGRDGRRRGRLPATGPCPLLQRRRDPQQQGGPRLSQRVLDDRGLHSWSLTNGPRRCQAVPSPVQELMFMHSRHCSYWRAE
ncbi:serine hydrolase [Streptomyces eurythermus]|uniref:serine hydrolase n=1 Tax=Streptomyces eurythermus TaxID=42237 RepID=UPI0036FAC7D9